MVNRLSSYLAKKRAIRKSFIVELMQNHREKWRSALEVIQNSGVSAGQVYKILDELESEGCVESKWISFENGRRRKLYKISSRKG